MQHVKLKEFTGCIEYHNGNIEWFKDGVYHREDGPACEYNNGFKAWYLNGKLHREDGPAREWADGNKEWWLDDNCCYIEHSDGSRKWISNNELHREDGPAVEWANGSREWWLNGKRHREDGPAVEYSNGLKEWHLNGKCLFWLPLKCQPFVLLEEFVDEEGKEQLKVLTQQGLEIWPNLPGLKQLAENWTATKS
jgi:hypothetical protein